MLRLSLFASAALTIAAVSFFGAYRYTSATNTVTPQDADVNHNGAVTIADAISVLPHIGQLAPAPSLRTYVAIVSARTAENNVRWGIAYCDVADGVTGGGISDFAGEDGDPANMPPPN